MLDLHPVFYKHQGWKLYRGDGIHFNERGHQVTADALGDFLESNRLIPPNWLLPGQHRKVRFEAEHV